LLLDRRKLLAAGTSFGAVTLLYGCGGGAEANSAQTETSAETAADGEVALCDGSQIEPINSDPINNPDGLADRPMGGVNADVTVIEYVSPYCPHCATFHATVLPEIKEKYIDTGRIRFITRPFRRNVLDLAVFMVAEASGEDYNEVLSAYLASQQQWATASNPRQAIFEIAEQFGFTQERFEEILTNEEMLAGLESMREQALNDFGLTGTPTFFINGDRLDGNATVETLSAEIDARL